MKRTALSRRTMLRGLAGGTAVMVGLPILDAMLNSTGTAFADHTALPLRIVMWCFGNGVLLNRWVPGGVRTPITGPNYPLSECLAPLQNVKDYMSVVSGFDNKCKYKITHHEGMTVFNGYTFADQGQGPGFFSNARGPTIDQVYANWLNQQADKPAIIKGVHGGVVSQISQADYGTTMHNVSHVDKLNPNPPIKNPQTIHQMFVDLFTPPDDPSKPTRLAVVDTVLEDAKVLRNKLGTVDQARLDGHLDGLYDLQQKIEAIAPLCEIPPQPTATKDTIDGMVAVNAALSDLIAFSFACDAARIASNLFVGGASEAPLIQGGSSQHGYSHSVSANALPYGGQTWKPNDANAPAYSENGPVNSYTQGVVFMMSQLAYLCEKLKNTPDAAGGNLLDNSVVYVSSDCSDGWTHDIRYMPILVIGRAGGHLKYPGIHLLDTNGRNTSDVLLTVLQSVMPTATEVGSTSYLLGGAIDPAYSNNPVVELKGV